jgi:ABC-type uncharacterized transport system auxiliary subunit
MPNRRLSVSALAFALVLCGCDGGQKNSQVEGEFKPADTSQFDQMKTQMIKQVTKSGGKVKTAPAGGANGATK